MALENRLRKSRTAAGIVPPAKASNSSRIRARGKLNTSLKNCRNVTFGIHKKHVSHGTWPGKLPAKASNSIRIRARSMQNTTLKHSRNVTFGIHEKHVSHGTWPWKTACESLEQQQESCRLRKPRTAAGFVPEAN